MNRSAPAVVAMALLAAASPAWAGGRAEIIDLTAFEPSPVPGEFVAGITPFFIDLRCMPMRYRINTTLDPIPNPLGDDFLTLAQALPVLRAAAETWNRVPTSYIDLRIEGTSSNTGRPGFDQIHEITFRSGARGAVTPLDILSIDAGPIAAARTSVLATDILLLDGMSIDADADPDVSSAITQCGDVDGDGDFELPEGFYEAGAILDTDIVYFTGVSTVPGGGDPGFRFTVGGPDADPRSMDLLGITVQTFGLAIGVAHSLTNQAGPANGRGSTLFPLVDTSDPAAELALRTLDVDAIATASLAYPEGSAPSGLPALQDGDVPFAGAFGFITGEARHGALDQPLVGANIRAIDEATGEVVTTAISGHSRWSVTPDGRGATFLDADFHVIDGRYTLVVPPGRYRIGIESVEETPANFFSLNFTTFLANAIGQNRFEEELFDAGESDLERRPAARSVVQVEAGETVDGIDIVTNDTLSLASYGTFDRRGPAGAQPGSYLAVRISGDQFLTADASLAGRALILGGAFLTAVEDASVVPLFAEALLTTGRVNPNGTATLDLKSPLAKQKDFAGQDFDFAPLWFDNSVGLTQKVRNGIAQGKIEDLFLVLRLPAGPFPGPSGAAPRIGLDGGVTPNDVPIGGSFRSASGAVFQPDGQFNYMFKLILGEDPR